MKLDFIAEQDEWVAINKPSGLLSIPDREGKEVSLKILLQEKYGSIYTVHRLDKDTSGVIVFARTESMHKYLSEAFEGRTVEKFYYGLVSGTLLEKEKHIEVGIMEHPVKRGTMIVHQKGKLSITDYEVVEELGKYSWLRFQIHTGRTHQIRVHMKNEGHPIVCDPLYGDGEPILLSALKKKFKLSKNEETERPLMGRLALHAAELKIPMPDGTVVELQAPLPKDLSAMLNQLRKLRKG